MKIMKEATAEYDSYFRVRGAEPTGFPDFYIKRHPEMMWSEFTCLSDLGTEIRGMILRPEGQPCGLIVMTQGFNLTIESYLPLGRRFTLGGFAVLLFDGVGNGRSGGDSINGMPQHVKDMSTVLDQVEKDAELGALPLFLFGHSWAGYAAAAVSCVRSYPIRGIVTFSAFRDALSCMKPTIRRRYGKLAPFMELPAWMILFRQCGLAARYSTDRGLRRADCPVRMYHSRDDVVVSYKESFLDVKKALAGRRNIRYVSMDGRGHDLYLLPENSRRQLQIRKLLREEQKGKAGGQPGRADSRDDRGSEERKAELWELMCEIDEKLARECLSFYRACLRSGKQGDLQSAKY